MAEARNAIQVFQGQKKGVKLLFSDEGIEVSFVIPHPSEIRQTLLRSVFRVQRAFLKGVYPASPILTLSIIGVVISVVLAAGKDSWWRNGSIAWMLWNSSFVLVPGSWWMPHSLLVGLLAAWGGFFGLLLLMYVQRIFLRILLSYRGWMYLPPKETSYVVLVWGGLLQLIHGRNPLTYAFQEALPRLPLPSLRDTCEKYLESVHPILDQEEYTAVEKMAQAFLKKDGPTLQRYLHFKSWWSSNYVTDWWEEYVYMKGRSSLMINSNYYTMSSSNYIPTAIPAARAAAISYHFMMFKQQLDRELLDPLMLRGVVPLCMQQYKRIFSTTRIPGREVDKLKTYSIGKSKHAAVLCNRQFYKMPLYLNGAHGRLLSAFEIQQQLETILAVAEKHPGVALPALTSMNRTRWAEVREEYFSEGNNKASIDVIDSAVFLLILDEAAPQTWNERGRSLFHGDGGNRWFDKSLSVVAFKNGCIGLNVEHSWADAPVVAHLWEYTMAKETVQDMYDKSGNIKQTGELSKSDLPPVSALTFDIDPPLIDVIDTAVENGKIQIADLDLQIIAFSDYGKGFMKSKKTSPDAFLQMVLQLAYYRDAGEFTQTYEASMTRLYKHGRTETVRVVTDASKAFILALVEGESKSKCIQKFKLACDKHQDLYRKAMSGKGVDRHLFTLYCVSVGMGIESKFLKDALGRPWKLSTSQQPQQQTSLGTDFVNAAKEKGMTMNDIYSPGGGFGPVVDDGYGVSYMITGENQVCFHISSKKASPSTNSSRFARHLCQSFKDLKAMWE